MDRRDPLKHRTVKAQQRPFVNDKLRKAINVKGHLRIKYHKIKFSHSWNIFRESSKQKISEDKLFTFLEYISEYIFRKYQKINYSHSWNKFRKNETRFAQKLL